MSSKLNHLESADTLLWRQEGFEGELMGPVTALQILLEERGINLPDAKVELAELAEVVRDALAAL